MREQNSGYVILLTLMLVFSVVQCGKAEDDEVKAVELVEFKNGEEVKPGKPVEVKYDARSIIVGGKRVFLFSGSVHYPRLPSSMWEDILDKCKEGGLNNIQTYAFWNVHEPVQNKYEWEGEKDIVRFIKMCAERGMWVTLRIGPFIQAEWNNGGLPFWLREIKGMSYRTDNPQYKEQMAKWFKVVVNLMKENNLYAPQGGPIIMSQVENEYDHIREAYEEAADRYVKWAAKMALDLKTDVPWIMCKTEDAPGEVVNTCNGRHCADTWKGPNHHTKPKMWTENWTAQYRAFGDAPSQRAAEDIAYGVARWFSMNGSHVNYYMYYGGTNYGRTSAAFVTTRYYDEAPIDEFGLLREPKWGHLRDLHQAIRLGQKALFEGDYFVQSFGPALEARWYEKGDLCAAFLWSNHTHDYKTVKFKGQEYIIPPKSVSVLPDCKTVVYNSDHLVSQHNSRSFIMSEKAHKKLKWEKLHERIPNHADFYSPDPKEQFSAVKDVSDYMWYQTSIQLDNLDLPFKKSLRPVLMIISLGHAIIAYVNGKYVGTEHGVKREYTFPFQVPVSLYEGVNNISILSNTVGMPDSGSYMEKRFTGLRTVLVQGLGTGNLDVTMNGWHHTIGLMGEKFKYFTEEGSKEGKWVSAKGVGEPLTWYKAYFDEPEGESPVAVVLENMTKGMAWVNGQSIGRYWSTYHTVNKKPSQSQYHIPRSFLKPKDNLLVIFDEAGGNIDTVEIQRVHRDIVCSSISEDMTPHVENWVPDGNSIALAEGINKPIPKAIINCPRGRIIKEVDFASFGNPDGVCGFYLLGNCTVPGVAQLVEKECMGKEGCEIPVDRNVLQDDGKACPEFEGPKKLTLQLRCVGKD